MADHNVGLARATSIKAAEEPCHVAQGLVVFALASFLHLDESPIPRSISMAHGTAVGAEALSVAFLLRCVLRAQILRRHHEGKNTPVDPPS